METAGWIGLSVFSSTALYLVNVKIDQLFDYAHQRSIGTLQLLLTWLFIRWLLSIGAIRLIKFPLLDKWFIALVTVFSFICTDESSNNNSVGMYHVSKLLCIPYMVALEFLNKRVSRSFKELVFLGMVVGGALVLFLVDLEVNLIGSAYAVLSIFLTSHSQLIAMTCQNEFNLSGPEFQSTIVLEMFFISLISSFWTECFGDSSVFHNPITPEGILVVVASCIFFVGSNTATYGLMAKTSAITCQVIGYMRTLILIIVSLVLFPSDAGPIIPTVIGMVISFVGVFGYTVLTLTAVK